MVAEVAPRPVIEGVIEGAVEGAIEWATVAPGVTIVANSGRAFVHREFMGSRWGESPTSGSADTVARLLDGAIAAGAEEATADELPAPLPMTPLRWAFRLCRYYHTTHATLLLMALAAEKLAHAGRARLAEWVARKQQAERGHDELALLDLQALGFDARAAVASIVPEAAAALVDIFSAAVHAPDPIGCVGHAYALERTAILVGRPDIDAIQAVLPPGVDATRCLRVHSTVGSDAAHVREAILLLTELSPRERGDVARAAFATATAIYDPRADERSPEAALAERFSPFLRAPRRAR